MPPGKEKFLVNSDTSGPFGWPADHKLLPLLSTLYTPSTVGVDAFGRSMGINVELLQVVHKKGIALTAPIDGVQTLKGGQAAIAYGTFTTKYADPNMPPGQGN
jgi:hypothetical protein